MTLVGSCDIGNILAIYFFRSHHSVWLIRLLSIQVVDLQHFILKTLHDGFLQSDRIKEQFVENDAIALLCDLLVVELEHKVTT